MRINRVESPRVPSTILSSLHKEGGYPGDLSEPRLPGFAMMDAFHNGWSPYDRLYREETQKPVGRIAKI